MTDINTEVKYALQLVGTDISDRMNSYGPNQSPDEMLKRIMGYAAICADKQASFISSQPLRLYRRLNTNATQATKGTRRLSEARKKHLLSVAGVGAKTAIWAEQAGDVEEVIDAPVLKLLHKPNEDMLGSDFAYALAWGRATTGNSYQYIERNSRGEVTGLFVMFPQYVKPIIQNGELKGYAYGDRNSETFSKQEVIHQKYRPSRFSAVYGECPLHSCLMAVDILNAQNMRELCFQENNARPDFAIKVPSEASPQQMIDTENKFNSKMRGHKQAGKFIVVKDSEITPLGFSPKDLEGMNLRREMKQEIFAAYGISETEFSTNDANLASSITGNLQFYRNIKPLLIKNAEELTNSLIPLFYPDAEEGEYFFAYDEIIPEVAKPQLTAAERVSLGIMSINEMRAEIGLGPIEGGDALRVNGQTLSNLDAASMASTLTALPAPTMASEAQQTPQPTPEPTKALDASMGHSACLDANCGCGKSIETKGYAPTDGMVEEALRGLKWREEYGRGGTEVGVARARDISNRRELSEDTIYRMVSYFARHEVDKQGQGWNVGEDGYPSAGRIAWALWGGDDGRTWANNIADGLANAEKNVKGLETLYSPNDRMVEEALRGMLWSMEYGRGGDEASRKVANVIIQRGRINIDDVRTMAVYFANMKLQVMNQGWDGGEGYPNADRITYAMYGGDAGKAWTDMVMGGIQPVGGLPPNSYLGPDEGALAAPTAEHKDAEVLPPVSYEFPMSAEERVAERNEIWRKKIYCDHKTDTKMARKEVTALTSIVNDLYLKASNNLKVHADGTIDLGNFEDMLAVKLGEYLFPTMYRGAQDAAVRLAQMTRGKTFKNFKAAIPNLDVVPETALENLANYAIQLSRQITQNEMDELKKALDDGMRQGLSISVITQNIKTAINENATFKAERIARTETARAYVTGQSVTWREAGVEKVEPILAPNSCSLCASLVTKGAYPVDTPSSDRVPFHPSCRCDEVPVLE